MFGFGKTINSIHHDFEKLIRLQKNIVNSFDTTISKIQNEKEASENKLDKAVKALVPVGNARRYDELTEASKAAGADFDCAGLVHKWTAQDNANRNEHERLESSWGDRRAVAEKEAKEKETLSVMEEALDELSVEVEEFDKTTANIAAHNARYANHQITPESHDDYESTNVWRWLGYYTFIHRGPHAAHLALGSYTDETGQDYFEYKAEIEDMRETKAGLTEQVTEQQEKYDEVAAVLNRMEELDTTYRGPEGIARDIRAMISDFLVKDDDFAVVLNDHMQSENAHHAALAVAKIRAYDTMTTELTAQKGYAETTLNNLQSPIYTLENARYQVGNRRINFDMDSIGDAVNANAVVMRGAVRKAEEAIQNVDNYDPQEGPDFFDMQQQLSDISKLGFSGSALHLDFSGLESLVRNEVSEYEAEQAAKRAAEEAAAAAARAAMRASFEAASRTRSRRNTVSTDFGSRASRTRSSVSPGSRGRSSAGRSSVSMGRRGR